VAAPLAVAALRRRRLMDSTTIPFPAVEDHVVLALADKFHVVIGARFRPRHDELTLHAGSSLWSAGWGRWSPLDSLAKRDRQARGHAARGGHQHCAARAITPANVSWRGDSRQPLVIPGLEAVDVQLNGPATREDGPRHHELSHRNAPLADVAFLSVGWTALHS
jgi:hypothetical protein